MQKAEGSSPFNRLAKDRKCGPLLSQIGAVPGCVPKPCPERFGSVERRWASGVRRRNRDRETDLGLREGCDCGCEPSDGSSTRTRAASGTMVGSSRSRLPDAALVLVEE